MQEDCGDDFDGDRARVVWSLGPGLDGDRSTTAPQPSKDTSAGRIELQLVSDLSAEDGILGDHNVPEARPSVRSLPSPRPNQREVPRSFTHPPKMRMPSKKKSHASLRTLVGVGAPAKHADAKSMAALLKGVTPAPKLPQQRSDKTVDNSAAARSPVTGLGARQGLTLAANSTPVAGLQHDASPHAAPPKTAPRSQLRSLNAPPTGMTMAKLLAKRPLPTPGELPSTPPAAMSITPCPTALTPLITPHSGGQIECGTPVDAINPKVLASANTPSLSALTPILVPGSKHRNPSRTPASLLQSSRSASGTKAVQHGLRTLPGAAVAQAAVHCVGDAPPRCPSVAADHRQRTHADLFAGVPKQDKPSSLFTPMAPKPKRQKDKAGGMQQKLEVELDSLRHRQEAGLQLSIAELAVTPHIRCQTVCEPAFEGQLVKLLCDVENVQLPSQDGSTDQGAGGGPGGPREEAPANRILEDVSQAFVYFDHSAEKHVSLRIGAQFCVLSPWDVVMTPFSELPVVLAHVTIPQPHQ